MSTEAQRAAFYARLDTQSVPGCHLWTGGTEGSGYRQIAREVGLSKNTVMGIVQRAQGEARRQSDRGAIQSD